MIDAALDDHIQIKGVFMQIKIMRPVVYFHNLDTWPAPEFIQKELFLFSENGM